MATQPGEDDFGDEEFISVEGEGRNQDPEDQGGGNDTQDGGATLADDDIQVVMPADDELEEEPADTVEGGAAEDQTGDDVVTDGGQEGQAQEADNDLQAYSVPVRKRIMRERRIAREAREERGRESAKNLDLERKLLQSTRTTAELTIANIDTQIAAETARLKKAKEDGDTDAEIEAQGKLNDAQSKKREMTTVKERLEQAEKELAKPAQGGVSDQARAWMDRNKWFNGPQFFAESAAVRVLDAQVAREGLDKNSEAYFKRLDSLIREKLPGLRTKLQAQQQRRPSASGPSAPVSRASVSSRQSAGGPQAGRKVVKLTRADVDNMVNFKMDPKNPEHIKEYARNKMRGG